MLSDLALSGVLGLVDNIHIFGTALQYRLGALIHRHISNIANHLTSSRLNLMSCNSSGRNSKLTDTLVPALTSLGQLTKRLNMEEQFAVDLLESPEYPENLPPPEC